MLDRIPLVRAAVPASVVLERWRRMDGDRPIQFPTFVTAANAIYYPNRPTIRRGSPSLGDADFLGRRRVGARARDAVTVAVPATSGIPALMLDLPVVERSPAWIELDGIIRDGSFLYCIYDKIAKQCVVQRLLPEGASGRFFLSLPKTRHRTTLYVLRQTGVPARMTFEAVHLHVARAPTSHPLAARVRRPGA